MHPPHGKSRQGIDRSLSALRTAGQNRHAPEHVPEYVRDPSSGHGTSRSQAAPSIQRGAQVRPGLCRQLRLAHGDQARRRDAQQPDMQGPVSSEAGNRTAINGLQLGLPGPRPRSLGTGLCVLRECGDDVDTIRVLHQAACRQEGACPRVAGQWQHGAKEAPTFQETREQIGRSVPVPHPERCGIRVSGAGYSPPPN